MVTELDLVNRMKTLNEELEQWQRKMFEIAEDLKAKRISQKMYYSTIKAGMRRVVAIQREVESLKAIAVEMGI